MGPELAEKVLLFLLLACLLSGDPVGFFLFF